MREAIRVWMAIGILVASAAPLAADTFVVSVPDLVGSYSPGAGKTAHFDFGTTFLTVEDARIQWTGTLIPGLGHGDGVEAPPGPFAWPTQIRASLDPPGWGYWSAYLGPVSGGFSVEQPFTASWPSLTWDFLLDGEDDITVALAPLIIIGGVMDIPPTGYVSEARLIVDGTVPEPGSLLLVLVGTLSVIRRRRQ